MNLQTIWIGFLLLFKHLLNEFPLEVKKEGPIFGDEEEVEEDEEEADQNAFT